MGADCCDHTTLPDSHRGNRAFRRVLWAVLAINAVMFAVEIGAGLAAGSAALQADALDFLGDSANYAISLFVAGMPLRYRAMAALAKGTTMGLFGLWVIATVLWHAAHGTLPSAFTIDYGSQGPGLRLLFRLGGASSKGGICYKSFGHQGS